MHIFKAEKVRATHVGRLGDHLKYPFPIFIRQQARAKVVEVEALSKVRAELFSYGNMEHYVPLFRCSLDANEENCRGTSVLSKMRPDNAVAVGGQRELSVIVQDLLAAQRSMDVHLKWVSTSLSLLEFFFSLFIQASLLNS